MIKKAMIHYIKNIKVDNIYTPIRAVLPVLSVIDRNIKTIWECCDDGKSKITEVLKNQGYTVISSDIVTGFNFLEDVPDFNFDMIITNPPYSLKTEFIEKCYSYKKPFALLLPLTALEGIKRVQMYKAHGINVLLLNKRVDFTGKNRVWFPVAWFFYYPNKQNNRIFYE